MRNRFMLPPLIILLFVAVLFGGEMMAGATLLFSSMMAIAVIGICVTYNCLGGLASMSGIAFTRFALSTLVISQVGKVLVLEKADQNLYSPDVVISVYALFFLSAMLGVMTFSRLRLPLPQPAEPQNLAQSRYLYFIALAGGLLGMALGYLSSFRGQAGAKSLAHGLSLVLMYLLPFSLVLAVDYRIRDTEGRHGVGWMALWPALAMEINGFVNASRTGFMLPFAVIFVTCYVRDFTFRRRHFAAAAALAVGFVYVVSPFYLYARVGLGLLTPREWATAVFGKLEQAPSQWSTITYQVGGRAVGNSGAVNYFSSPSAVTLNRFALIGPDSTLINACVTGFHYGFTSFKLDLLSQIPRILYPNKPDFGSGQYLGQLDGQEIGFEETTTDSTITVIADSYGAFSWLGVALFAFLAFPAVFVLYESMFDVRRPWGTLAAVSLLIGLTEGSMGTILFTVIKASIYILILSWAAAWIVRMIPSGDHAANRIVLRRAAAAAADSE